MTCGQCLCEMLGRDQPTRATGAVSPGCLCAMSVLGGCRHRDRSWATLGSRHQAVARATCDQRTSVTFRERGTPETIQHRVSVSQRETEEQQQESLQWAAPQSPGGATGASCKCFLSCNDSDLVESSQCNHDSNCVFLKSRFPN